MRRDHLARLAAAAFTLSASTASADDVVLDLPAVLARAEAAPAAVAARARIDLARAARVGAAVRFTDNPELELEGGPRLGDTTTTDVSVAIGQTFALGGGRGARRAVAEAGVAQAEAAADAALLAVQREAALAFLRALHAERVAEASRAASELAERAAEAAERRLRAGDVTDLDVELARAAAGRASAAVLAAGAERAAAVAALAPLVGLAAGDTVTLRGDLRAPALAPAELDGALARRADLRALDGERAVAEAEGRLARASGAPSLGLWLGYAHEEDAELVRGGLRVTLPLWERGQGGRAEARARSARASAEAQVARAAATREVADAQAVYEQARAAADRFEAEVLPRLERAEALLVRGLDAGALTVGEVLVARQELLAGRREHLDRLLAVAEARVTALFAAGVTP